MKLQKSLPNTIKKALLFSNASYKSTNFIVI